MAKPTHFFKIIHDNSQNLREGKLMIPRKFVEKHGKALPQNMFLKLPNGATWKLNLVKNDTKMWFQEGWKEFVEHHSLGHGHLLVFRYEGTSHFQVYIFDTSASEINYPMNRGEPKRVFNGQGNKSKPQNVENLEDQRGGIKRKAELSLEDQRTCKESSKMKKPMTVLNTKKITAFDRARSFETSNPSFLLVMPQSYIIGHGPLNFPRKFVKKHLDLNLDSDSDKKRGDIHLRVSNGKVYPLRYVMRKGNILPRFELTSGWKTVVTENNLKVGDVCTFELIHRTELTFQVHIFRKMEKLDSSKPQKPSKMREVTQGERKPVEIITSGKQIITAKKVTTLKRGCSFKTCSQSASFHVVMHRTHIEDPSRLNLPYKFGERHLDLGKEDGNINLQVSNGKVWPAKFLIKKYETRTRFVVKGGWKTFVKDNDLKVGDLCNFELIPGTQFTFKVYIFKDSIGKHTTQLVQHLKNLPKLEQLLKDEDIKSES